MPKSIYIDLTMNTKFYLDNNKKYTENKRRINKFLTRTLIYNEIIYLFA
jgi:hypothetical protein